MTRKLSCSRLSSAGCVGGGCGSVRGTCGKLASSGRASLIYFSNALSRTGPVEFKMLVPSGRCVASRVKLGYLCCNSTGALRMNFLCRLRGHLGKCCGAIRAVRVPRRNSSGGFGVRVLRGPSGRVSIVSSTPRGGCGLPESAIVGSVQSANSVCVGMAGSPGDGFVRGKCC